MRPLVILGSLGRIRVEVLLAARPGRGDSAIIEVTRSPLTPERYLLVSSSRRFYASTLAELVTQAWSGVATNGPPFGRVRGGVSIDRRVTPHNRR